MPPRPHNAELGLPIPLLELESSDDATSESSAESASESEPDLKDALPVNPKTAKTTSSYRDPRILQAEIKGAAYRVSKKSAIHAGPSALRAYYLWHGNPDLTPKAIASLLRDPPLQTNTVITYVLDTISSEKLPYDVDRAKQELFGTMNFIPTRYAHIAQSCSVQIPKDS